VFKSKRAERIDGQVKLRIRDNSVRLRLTRSEVDAAGAAERVAGRTRFVATQDFVYALESCDSSPAPTARFDGETLLVRVPANVLRAWATSDEVSIRGEEVLPGGGVLSLLVEKDFACLAPRDGEDESDMFVHPRAGEND